MTTVDPEVRAQTQPALDERAVERLARICPYLAAADGAWRSATVTREHRCGAVTPPAPLAAEKQRRLCLTSEHLSCATFEAARAARPIAPERMPTLPRPLARTTPMVLDHGRVAITVPALRADRTMAQAILILLMALAFVAIILAKVTGSAPASASAGSPSLGATAGVSSKPSAGPAAAATTSVSLSAAPTSVSTGAVAGATDQPAPAPGTRTYKVKSGDTLVGIAAKFKTTAKAISNLNGITDPTSLKIGQTLKIP
jgi:LysM repeat protein